MGQPTPGSDDLATVVQSGTLTAGQTSPLVCMSGPFNVSVRGAGAAFAFTGSVQLVRSFDGGATVEPVTADAYGTSCTYTGPVSTTVAEFEQGVLFGLSVPTLTANGPITYRLSK